MPSVKNIVIQKKPDSEGYYATWTFNAAVNAGGTIFRDNYHWRPGETARIRNSCTKTANGVPLPADHWWRNQIWWVSNVVDQGNGNYLVTLGQNHQLKNWCNAVFRGDDLISDAEEDAGGSGGGTVAQDTLDHYEYFITYDPGTSVWLDGSSGSVTNASAEFSVDKYVRFKITVTPIAKEKSDDVPYWIGTPKVKLYSPVKEPPPKPSTPSCTLRDNVLTVTLENISDMLTDYIRFRLHRNGDPDYAHEDVQVIDRTATCKFVLHPGGVYRVSCIAFNDFYGTRVPSEESDNTSEFTPPPPGGLTISSHRAMSTTSIRLDWSSVETADTYDVEYTNDIRYFDASGEVTQVNGIRFNYYEFTGLETGKAYYFRVRAVNDAGESSWSDIYGPVLLGKKPGPPTTWSTGTKVRIGDPLVLYWIHNSYDGSSEKKATLEISINGHVEEREILVPPDILEDDEFKTKSYEIVTESFNEQTHIEWRVKTCGVTMQYGDYSIMRTVDIYPYPYVNISLCDQYDHPATTFAGYPIIGKLLSGPYGQSPLAYTLTLAANESYNTIDSLGNRIYVRRGDVIFKRTYSIDNPDTIENYKVRPMVIELTPNDVLLESGVHYTFGAMVSTDSGLTGYNEQEFYYNAEDPSYEIFASVAIDKENYSAWIRPWCVNEDGELVDDVELSIYRRETDGTFTEIVSGLSNDNRYRVRDPHPALDYARYRVIAKDMLTGKVVCYDVPDVPIQCKSIIVQWGDLDMSSGIEESPRKLKTYIPYGTFKNVTQLNENPVEVVQVLSEDPSYNDKPKTNGFLLKLPYNINISDTYDNELNIVKYAGRRNPVTYYGTQHGVSATFTTDVPKTDSETLYMIKRLAVCMQDVYVREPSGVGYWASVNVSYSINHDSLVVPINLGITKTEGGM